MQPLFNNLITQNEYFDYQRAIRNVTNYNLFGLCSVTLENGNLLHNPNYGFIQSIKDIFCSIFFKDYHLDDINNKKLLLARDFKIINDIYGRYSKFPKKPTTDRDELYEIFYTTLIANDFVKLEHLYRYVLSKEKSDSAIINRCLDFLTGYSLPKTLDRRIQWPEKNSVNYFSVLHGKSVNELVQFILNTCENIGLFHLEYNLKMLLKENSDARVMVRYCFAVSEYMRREDKQTVFEQQNELRQLLVQYSLLAIEKNWNEATCNELLQKVATMMSLLPSELNKEFEVILERLTKKLPSNH